MKTYSTAPMWESYNSCTSLLARNDVSKTFDVKKIKIAANAEHVVDSRKVFPKEST